MIKKIEHVGIKVRDLDEAVRFYTQVLGLTERDRREIPASGVKIAFVAIGDSELELLHYPEQKDDAPSEGVVSHVALAVDDIEAVLQKVKESGAVVRDETPRMVFGGSKIAFFQGPSGEILELFQK
ncbi:MAG: VOC family protein [bacterium]|jgi:lactoylglutathione lyase